MAASALKVPATAAVGDVTVGTCGELPELAAGCWTGRGAVGEPNAVGVGVGALDWTAVLEGTPKKHELLKANDHESEEASQQAFLEDCGVSHGFHHPSWTTSRLPPLAKIEVSSLSLTLFQPTTKHTLLLKRSQEPRPATTKNFETFTTKL